VRNIKTQRGERKQKTGPSRKKKTTENQENRGKKLKLPGRSKGGGERKATYNPAKELHVAERREKGGRQTGDVTGKFMCGIKIKGWN